MKKILLLLGILFVSVTGFSETLTGNFVPKIHQINGSITADTNEKEIIINKTFVYTYIINKYTYIIYIYIIYNVFSKFYQRIEWNRFL